MKNKSWIYLIAFVLMLLGTIISLQARSIIGDRMSKSANVIRLENLQASLDAAKKEREALEKKLDEAAKRIAELEKGVAQDSGSSESLLNELEKVKIQASLVDVKGHGLIITLNDADVRKGEYVNIQDTIIHDLDINELVNELRASGAQALAVNGERLIGTSEMVCAGPTIQVNGTKTATPFIITAIGNTDRMLAFLNRPDSIVKDLQVRKIRIDIKKADGVVVPKYKGKMMEEIHE